MVHFLLQDFCVLGKCIYPLFLDLRLKLKSHEHLLSIDLELLEKLYELVFILEVVGDSIQFIVDAEGFEPSQECGTLALCWGLDYEQVE